MLSPLSDIAAVLAASQLEQYTAFHERRRQVAERYWRALSAAAPAILRRAVIYNSTFFRFPVVVPGGLESVAAQFAARGVTVRTGADTLLHRLLGLPDAGFPAAVAHFEHTVSLPIYPALTDEELDRCIDAAVAAFAGTRSESPEMLRQ